MRNATLGIALIVMLAVAGAWWCLPATADLPSHSGYSTQIYTDRGGDRLVFRSGATISNEIGVGTVASHTGLSLTETGDGVTHKTVFTFAEGTALAITDHTTAGAHGSIQLYDFPAGYIKFLGSSMDVDVTCDDADITTTGTYEIGVGVVTVATDNAALTSTEETIIPGVASDLVDYVAALGAANATDASVDGTATAADAWFNAAFAADDTSGNLSCTVSGTITVTWVNLGDY